VTASIEVLSRDGTPLFKVTPREAFDEWRGDYFACALRFAGMHDAIAEAFDAPAGRPMPTLAELRGPDDLAEWEDDEGRWPEVAPVSRARRLLEWVLYG
jgi:hypothetical protein